jgi:dienelactone hydrolase
MRRFFRSVAVIALASATAPGQSALVAVAQGQAIAGAPVLWAGLTPGSHRVGYRVLNTSSSGVVHVWYPTAESGAPMRFADYAGNSAPQLSAFLERAGMNRSAIDSLFALPLFASATPRAAAGPFPLILVAQGNGQDVIDQVVLCEYLASQGFVVATTPSPMLRVPMEREDQVGQLAELQASDLSDAIDVVSAALPANGERISVVGHSFGARSALLLAMRDQRIRGLVSLDGGIGTATAVEPFRQAKSFRADAALPPLLHFYEELDAFMAPDFTLLRRLRFAELELVRSTELHHAHFTTYGFVAGVFPDIARATRATPSTTAALVAVAVKTADFLRRLH